MSEKSIQQFMRTMIAKYALSNQEILEQFIAVPFRGKTDLIQIIRSAPNLEQPLQIGFSTQVSDITMDALLMIE